MYTMIITSMSCGRYCRLRKVNKRFVTLRASLGTLQRVSECIRTIMRVPICSYVQCLSGQKKFSLVYTIMAHGYYSCILSVMGR
jgi:hypothetical protein